MKTYENWKGSLEEYLNVGDLVDEELVDHFVNVLPPKTLNYNMVQCGEAQSFVSGKNTYATFSRTSEGWMFKGYCHKGEIVEPVRICPRCDKEYHKNWGAASPLNGDEVCVNCVFVEANELMMARKN